MKRKALKRIPIGVVCVSAVLFAAPLPAARAADMEIKAPTASPEYNWTGFYLGVQGGYGWSYPEYDTTAPYIAQQWPVNGGFGGGTIGANYQFGATHVVVGVEGEWNGGDLTGRVVDVAGNSHSGTLTSFGSVGGRLGIALNGYAFDRDLIYIVLGAAFGDARQTFTVGAAGPSTSFASGNDVGVAFGFGVEVAVTNNWTVRGEWRMYDMLDTFFAANAVIPVAYSSHYTLNTGRLGIDYKFGY